MASERVNCGFVQGAEGVRALDGAADSDAAREEHFPTHTPAAFRAASERPECVTHRNIDRAGVARR